MRTLAHSLHLSLVGLALVSVTGGMVHANPLCGPGQMGIILRKLVRRNPPDHLGLGRELTPEQLAAYKRAKDVSGSEVYLPEEVRVQEGILSSAGFTQSEVAELRRSGRLGNAVTDYAAAVPSHTSLVELKLHELNNNLVRAAQQRKRFSYIVDSEDRMRLVSADHDFTSDTLWVVRDTASPGQEAILVKEAGTFDYDPKTRGFRIQPRYSLDLSPEESVGMMTRLEREHPGMRFDRSYDASAMKGRTVTCLKEFSTRNSGASFIADKIGMDIAIMTGVVAVQEAAGAGRLASGRGDALVADVAGGVLVSTLHAAASKAIVYRGSSWPVALASRAGVTFGGVLVQKVAYDALLTKEVGERSRTLTEFNAFYSGLKLPINHAVDRFIANRLPGLIFDACRKDSRLKVFISPRMIRLYDRIGSSVLYYGTRKAIIDE